MKKISFNFTNSMACAFGDLDNIRLEYYPSPYFHQRNDVSDWFLLRSIEKMYHEAIHQDSHDDCMIVFNDLNKNLCRLLKLWSDSELKPYHFIKFDDVKNFIFGNRSSIIANFKDGLSQSFGENSPSPLIAEANLLYIYNQYGLF